MEIWIMLADRYEVSNLGRFRRRNKSWPERRRARGQYRYITGAVNGCGYRQVWVNGKRRYLARIVLEAFVGPCPEGHECDHKNRDKLDNGLANLHWVTHSENNKNRRGWKCRPYKHKKNRV